MFKVGCFGQRETRRAAGRWRNAGNGGNLTAPYDKTTLGDTQQSKDRHP